MTKRAATKGHYHHRSDTKPFVAAEGDSKSTNMTFAPIPGTEQLCGSVIATQPLAADLVLSMSSCGTDLIKGHNAGVGDIDAATKKRSFAMAAQWFLKIQHPAYLRIQTQRDGKFQTVAAAEPKIASLPSHRNLYFTHSFQIMRVSGHQLISTPESKPEFNRTHLDGPRVVFNKGICNWLRGNFPRACSFGDPCVQTT